MCTSEKIDDEWLIYLWFSARMVGRHQKIVKILFQRDNRG